LQKLHVAVLVAGLDLGKGQETQAAGLREEIAHAVALGQMFSKHLLAISGRSYRLGRILSITVQLVVLGPSLLQLVNLSIHQTCRSILGIIFEGEKETLEQHVDRSVVELLIVLVSESTHLSLALRNPHFISK
jgi:hypothetical protein